MAFDNGSPFLPDGVFVTFRRQSIAEEISDSSVLGSVTMMYIHQSDEAGS